MSQSGSSSTRYASLRATLFFLCCIFSAKGQLLATETKHETKHETKNETEAQAVHSLSREDNQRSQFAGAKMGRIQSFDKPVGQNSGVPPQESSTAKRDTTAPESAQGLTRKPAGIQAADSNRLGGFTWEKGAKVPSKVYKNIPLHSVYLNGENIVGLRNQVLEGVNIRFDNQGNIFIDAPQYEIHHDSTFHPLLPEETPQYSKSVDGVDGVGGKQTAPVPPSK